MYNSPLCHSVTFPIPPSGAYTAADELRNSYSANAKPADNSQKKGKLRDRNRVLMLGRLRELALYRAEVLRSNGFQVEVSLSKDHALELIRRGDYDVVVVSYTLPDAVVRELTDEMREYCPECPVIAIANTRVPDRAIKPDHTVLADEGPSALIIALRRTLRRQ